MTEAEKAEQQALRAGYIDDIEASLRASWSAPPFRSRTALSTRVTRRTDLTGSATETMSGREIRRTKAAFFLFLRGETVLYYTCIGTCFGNGQHETDAFSQGGVSRARCTEKAVF
ncbi:MAG: hypothetical protein ACLVES_01245 [Faecalibacterium prausnitzii]